MGKMKISVILTIILLTGSVVYAEDVHQPQTAGFFYPKDKKALKKMVDKYIDEADAKEVDGKIIAVVAPHAGYPYSGWVAGYAFKAIKGRPFKTAIVVAPSHKYGFEGLAVLYKDSYLTPLGKVPIDKELTTQFLEYDDRIVSYAQPFVAEHAAEVEIPFLQESLEDFKIVVIITGVPSYDTCTLLRDALTAVVKGRDDIIIVASTDLSHHYPDSKARLIDKDNLTDIAAFDPELLFLKFSTMSNKDTPCGRTALIGTMMAARNLGANKIDVLKYATSGDVTIDKSAVVGYASLVIYKSSRQAAPQTETEMKEKEPKMEELLNAKQKRRLLVIARATLEAYIKERRVPDFKEEDPVLNEELGAFVTLHKNGQLRGCIGNMTGKGPLYLTIRDMAVSASTQDPRFPPVRKDELKDIDIEISVLSPMKIIDDPEKIVIGKHGVMVQKGFRSGVYLPQVGTETGWSRERFMDSLCLHKAGLPADSWKKGGCDIYIFTAEVFGEKETEE